MEDNKAILLKRLQISDFTLDEVGMYLDTHPNDQAALAYYKKYLELRNQTMKEYVEKYGPIVAEDYDGSPTWTWVNDPWPWENEREA